MILPPSTPRRILLLGGICQQRKTVSPCFFSSRLFKNKGCCQVLLFSFGCTARFCEKLEVCVFVFSFGNNLGAVPLQMNEDSPS